MAHGGVHPKKSSSRFSFVGDTIAELKKVVWLTRKEVGYLTTLVLIISLVAGLVLGAFDFGFSTLVELFLGG